MKKIKTSLICTLLFAVCTVYGQINNEKAFIDYNNIEMPVSPNAASLGTYGDTPVNTATGIPNINIPIYTLQVDGVSIPISLSYHASGIQVNELATAVGLKWTLNAGGAIFRSVSSRPDEDGWLTGHGPGPWGYGPLPNSFYDNWDILDEPTQSLMRGYPPDYDTGYNKILDHNPDHYTYNFLHFSGKYITDFGGDVIKNQADELIFDGKTIEDQMGNTYDFGQNGYVENSSRGFIYATDREGSEPPWPSGHDYDDDIETGWMLTTINTKNNKTISFEYEPYNIVENTPHIISTTIASGKECATNGDLYAEKTTTSVYNNYTVQLINKISSENVDILFEYSPEDDDLSTWKKKLTKITINDKVTGTFKEFNFDYDSYEGDPRLKLKRIFEKKNNQELPGYSFEYVEGDLPDKYSFAQDFFGYFNGKSSNKALVPWNENIRGSYFSNNMYSFGQFYDLNTGDRSHSNQHLQTGVLEIITYPTGGSTKFHYEPNAGLDSTYNIIKYCGGLRVKKIEDRDRFENSLKTTTYSYFELMGQSLETDLANIKTFEKNHTGDFIKQIFHSSFVSEQDGLLNGYFYKKVNTVVEEDGKQQKKESNFVENYSFGTLGHLLSSEKIFSGNTTIAKFVEYQYDQVGISETMHWNTLGHYYCLTWQISYYSGYGEGRHMQYTGNTTMLPIQITTTDSLKLGTSKEPVTTVQFIAYDDETLLKTIELTSTKYKNSSLTIVDQNAEEVTTYYTYPWSPGVNSSLPAALPIGKEVFSSVNAIGQIFGQFFEYDEFGNIKKTYQYDKGEVGNNSAPNYVPSQYEEMTNFIFENGKPVQMFQKSGEATSYIWGYNGQFPVAKIEGMTRAALNSQLGSLVGQIETETDQNEIQDYLDDLRNDTTTANAMVTTYTYEPLNGVKTITDPKGDIITFYYDAFGRLEQVKDKEGKILSENEYNYAH